jgi:hypothetical protein
MRAQGTGFRGQGTEVLSRGRRFFGPGLVLLAALLAVAPLLVRGDSCGHDFDFHLVSWFDALHAWRHGVVYPQWAPSPNFNAGEPRFVFYPPLTWMLGAALGAVLPWTLVAPAMVFLLLAGTGLATRALARQALQNAAATLAGCIAIFSGYTLYTVYERSALAELAGGIWMPLIVLLMLRRGVDARGLRRVVDGSAILLAVAVAGAWLSNAPVGVMSCYLLAAVALVVAVLDRSWVPVMRAAAGAALGLSLAAFYLVPAAVEQRWVDIRQAVDDPGERIQNSFLFGHHADPRLALHDLELHRVSWIAVAMLALALGGLLICAARKRLPGERRWWVAVAVIPATVLVLMLPVSLPVWKALPKLQFLQFPWRWLVAVEAPLGIFVAAAALGANRLKRWTAMVGFAAAFLCLTMVADRVFFQICDQYDAVPGMLQDYGDGGGFQGTDEYAPVGADNSLVAQDLPAGCLVRDPMQTLGLTSADDPQPDWAPAQKSCVAVLDGGFEAQGLGWQARGTAPEPGYVVLRLRRYPRWRVTVNGRSAGDGDRRDDGLLEVPVAAGPVAVDARWVATRDVKWGRAISAAGLLALVGLGLAAWQKKKVG